MIKIGEFNILKIARFVEFGAYLISCNEQESTEILLPKRYINDDMKCGDKLRVFIYTDSEDRPVATTEIPFAKVGEFAFLQTIQVNKIGAFLDWGLSKNLLVPFKEQKLKMFPGGIYLVYLYLDNNTQRVVASARIEKYLDNVFPDYYIGEKVDCLVISHNEIGYHVIVNNQNRGIIYKNEIFKPIEIGKHLTAYVKNIREKDNKIDLTLIEPGTIQRINKIAKLILQYLRKGNVTLNEKASSEDIKRLFECSKKDFKKAIGFLYKKRKITISQEHEIHIF